MPYNVLLANDAETIEVVDVLFHSLSLEDLNEKRF